MPEGPELHLASQFVNLVCKGRIFKGPIVKSEVSKHAHVEFEDEYTISATSRGKEMKLTLSTPCVDEKSASKIKGRSLDIVFQFGMSGRFDFYEATELKKHAHLNFFTRGEPRMVLSFVDYRRFGKWHVGGDWSQGRGPCVLFEYQAFRKNVLDNVKDSAFNKPICESLLNQKYFNGIGNYLRAEILYRAGIPPFVAARSVLEPLVDDVSEGEVKVKSESPDILQLCHTLPLEVVNLGGTGYDPEGRDPDYSKFTEWLQCYYKPDMENMADHNKRTIWYHGNPGPLLPKEIKTRGVKRSSKVAKNNQKKMKKGDLESKESNEDNDRSIIVTREKLHKAEDSDPKQTSAKSLKSSSKSLRTSSTKGRKSSSTVDVRKNGSALTRRKLAEEEEILNLKNLKFATSDYDLTSTRVVSRDSDTGTPKASKSLRGKRNNNSNMTVMEESNSRRQNGKSVVAIVNGRNSPQVTLKCARQKAARAERARLRHQR